MWGRWVSHSIRESMVIDAGKIVHIRGWKNILWRNSSKQGAPRIRHDCHGYYKLARSRDTCFCKIRESRWRKTLSTSSPLGMNLRVDSSSILHASFMPWDAFLPLIRVYYMYSKCILPTCKENYHVVYVFIVFLCEQCYSSLCLLHA